MIRARRATQTDLDIEADKIDGEIDFPQLGDCWLRGVRCEEQLRGLKHAHLVVFVGAGLQAAGIKAKLGMEVVITQSIFPFTIVCMPWLQSDNWKLCSLVVSM